MVHTFTLNPSLDMVVSVDHPELGKTNRSYNESIYPGGKGLNVSFVLTDLGVENTAVYFAAGFVGEEITRLVSERGIKTCLLPLGSGVSRINLKLRSPEGTEINGSGPEIAPEDEARLFEYLDSVKKDDYIVLSGSVPGTMKKDIYARMIRALAGRDVHIVVDASGSLLEEALEYRPFLVKPNRQELEELAGRRLDGREDIVEEAKKLQRRGAENVMVSLSGEGAVLVFGEERVYYLGVPEGRLVNPVGAGDSMIAGFIAGYLQSGDQKQAFRTAVAAGSACAYFEGFPTKDSIEEILTYWKADINED